MALLHYTYDEMRAEVGEYLGYGRTSGSWSAAQAARIANAIKTGYSWFVYPERTPERPSGHQWRFLELNTSITTSTQDSTLPANFGGMDGSMTLTGGSRPVDIAIVGENQIRTLRAESSATGPPQMAAIRAKAISGSAAQRWELQLWPNPSGTSYTLNYRYRHQPDVPTGSEYFFGGASHGETIRAACMAAAEYLYNEEGGLWLQRFNERLSTSISVDTASNVPDYYGRSVDNSDNVYEGCRWPGMRRDGCYGGGGTSFLDTSSGSTTTMAIEIDNLTMTGSEYTYTIPGGASSLLLTSQDGDFTVASATGGDTITVPRYTSHEWNATTLDTQDLFITGTSSHVVQVSLTRTAS